MLNILISGLAVILVVWMERNKRIFDAKSGIELEELWDGVSGHFYGPLFLRSLKITPYPLFFYIGKQL